MCARIVGPLLVAALIGVCTSAAPAAPIPTPAGTGEPGTLSAVPVAGYATWRASSGVQTVLTDAGVSRNYTIPDGCSGGTAGPDVIAYRCGGRLGLLRLGSGSFTRLVVELPGDLPLLTVAAVGSRWAIVQSSPTAHAGYTGLYNLRTGDIENLGRPDPFGARRVLDLDRRSGATRLCSGAHRFEEGGSGAQFAPATYVGRRLLTTLAAGSRLFSCAARTLRKVPGAAAINGRYLVTERAAPGDPLSTLTIRRLRDGETFKLPGARERFVLSRGALWLQDGTGAVTRVPLK